jgi:hypothetical protein
MRRGNIAGIDGGTTIVVGIASDTSGGFTQSLSLNFSTFAHTTLTSGSGRRIATR